MQALIQTVEEATWGLELGLIKPFPAPLIARLEAQVKALLRKYSPDQPRVPAGNPDGGEWTGGGGGGGRISVRDLDEGRADPVSFSPLDLVGGAAAGVGKAAVGMARSLGSLVAGDAGAVAEVLGVRASGASMEEALGAASSRISEAARSVESYLGGSIERVIRTDEGNYVFMSGDKKIRFDIGYPGKNEGVLDDPHFHIETLGKSGKWKDMGNMHRNYFKKD